MINRRFNKLSAAAVWISSLESSPLGAISVAVTEVGLRRVVFTPPGILEEVYADWVMPIANAPQILFDTITYLREFLTGKCHTISVPIDWRACSQFEQEVLGATLSIPFGEVRSYGEIAHAIGNPSAARAVGGALSRNPIPIAIPCHRVVDSQRRLNGYTAPGGLAAKAWLLQLEGHRIVNNKLD